MGDIRGRPFPGHAKALADQPNYITLQGFARLSERYAFLIQDERPKIVDTVSWAAGNGDRSENGDYLYGKKRLREIDRELGWLSKRMKAAKVVDPASQPDKARVWFGATVTITDERDNQRILTLIGDDETDTSNGQIGWNSPIARALRGATLGDVRRVTLPAGEMEYEVLEIRYA